MSGIITAQGMIAPMPVCFVHAYCSYYSLFFYIFFLRDFIFKKTLFEKLIFISPRTGDGDLLYSITLLPRFLPALFLPIAVIISTIGWVDNEISVGATKPA